MKKKLIKKKKRRQKTIREFKNFVQDVVNEVRLSHGLMDYKISYGFVPRVEDAPHQKVRLADIDVDDKYLTAHIRVYTPLFEHFRDGDRQAIKEALCHELAHIRTNALNKLADDRWACPEDVSKNTESLTELMGRLMYQITYGKDDWVKVKKIKNKK